MVCVESANHKTLHRFSLEIVLSFSYGNPVHQKLGNKHFNLLVQLVKG